jgi:hypothetical protein
MICLACKEAEVEDGRLQCFVCREGKDGREEARAVARVRKVEPEGWRDGDSVVVVLGLPPREIHPNGRCAGREKSALIRECRAAAKMGAKLAGWAPGWRRATLESTFYVAHHQEPDDDGLVAWLKPHRDGLADAGLVMNDRGIKNADPVVVNGSDRPRLELRLTERSGTGSG